MLDSEVELIADFQIAVCRFEFPRSRHSTVMLLVPAQKQTILIALAICSGLLYSSCRWSNESSFFANFSMRQFVEQSKSSAGLNCDVIGGGGSDSGGIGSRAGGLSSGGTHFNSYKSDSIACRLEPTGNFDETKLFSALKLAMESALHDNGAQITDSGSTGSANFYFAYTLKNVRGRVQVSGTRIGADYYDVHANLDETGN
jgi:hypothetical protein